MPRAAQTHRAVSLRPYLFFDPKTGEVLEKDTILSSLREDLRAMQALVQWQLDATDDQLLQDLAYRSEPPNAAGFYVGLNLPSEVKTVISRNGRVGLSRFEKIWRGEVVAHLRSWIARKDVNEGVSKRFVSTGWKRTASIERPTAMPRMNLGYADAQYAYWIDQETLALVTGGRWVHARFSLPRRHKDRYPSLPTLRLNENDEVVFDFSLFKAYQQGLISTRFVVGVDVGKTVYASVSVWDAKEGKTVFSTPLSRRVRSLQNSVEASEKQVRALQRKATLAKQSFDFDSYTRARGEASLHRAKNSCKKRELAIITAQEVAALAYSFENAVVVVEDLSWVVNTMQNGRWNRGAFVAWLTHFVELNGSRVLKVNAAYTSQRCSVCSGEVSFRKRVAVCDDSQCDHEQDRDLNAASNIAKKACSSVVKMDASRRKSKAFRPVVSRQESASPPPVLKHPGQARRARKQVVKVFERRCAREGVLDKPPANVSRDGRGSALPGTLERPLVRTKDAPFRVLRL